ncbi:MAG: aspartyl/asparaginyl beta-hydroxylase domain-containing protein [Micromonosporaceae bacterium]
MSITANPTPAALPAQVGALRPIAATLVERMRHEVMTVPTDWVIEYGDYQNGGWNTLSLLNDTGDPRDVTIRDCAKPMGTSLLRQMPAVAECLDGLGLTYMWVRLARLDAGSFLWEHRDYGELSAVERHRLHVPLVSNSSAYLVLGGTKVHMSVGRVWRLTPTVPHGVCNLFGPQRIHLMLDCYADEALHALANPGDGDPCDAQPMPALSPTDLDEKVATARGLAELGYERAAETGLLELFYRYAMPEGQVYDLIVSMYASLHREEDATRWRVKKNIMLGRD